MRRRDLLPLLALAGASAAPAVCASKLIAGVSPLGWALYEDHGQLRGVAVDLLARVSQVSGCAIQLGLRPRARALLDFQNGEVDLIPSVSRKAERDLVGDFEPYAYSGNELVLNPDLAPTLTTLEGFERQSLLKLGLVRGVQMPGPAGALIERLIQAGRIEWAVDYSNLALRMVRDRVPAGLFPIAVHLKLAHDGELPRRFRVRPLADNPPQPIGVYVSHRVPEAQRKALLEAVRALARSGEVQRIYGRHLGEDVARALFESGRAASAGVTG